MKPNCLFLCRLQIDLTFFALLSIFSLGGQEQVTQTLQNSKISFVSKLFFSEWASGLHRDTIASNLGHFDMLCYFAVAQNDSIGRVRYQLLERMLQPCGPPPEKEEETYDDT